MRFCIAFVIAFSVPAFAGPCEDDLSGEIAKIQKILDSGRPTRKQVQTAIQKLKKLAETTVNSEALIVALESSSSIEYIEPSERDTIIQNYLMRPENRELALKRFDVFFYNFLEAIAWNDKGEAQKNFDTGLDRAELYFQFMETLRRENPKEFSEQLLLALNTQAKKNSIMHANPEGVKLIFDRTMQTLDNEDDHDEVDVEDEDADLMDDEPTPQNDVNAGKRSDYVRILISELEKPVDGSSVKSLLKVSHDEIALINSNLQLQEDVGEFASSEYADTNGALRPVVFHYRLAKHFLPALERTPAFLHILEPEIKRVSDLLRGIRPELGVEGFLAKLRSSDKDQVELVKTLARTHEFKRKLFSASSLSGELKNPQRWLTIHNPEQVHNHIRAAFEISNSLKARVSKALKQKLGHVWAKIEADPEYLKYYADEVYDTFVQEGGSPFEAEKIKLRYIRRILPELKLGNRCGDCTSVGSVNFGPSTTWFYNPGYQIITFSKGSRFLGKINLALLDMDGKPSILIDALEFNPQALPGKPYYHDAKEALDHALSFAKELANDESRQLLALVGSNSTEANNILASRAIPHNGPAEVKGRFAYNEKAVRAVLNLSNDVQVKPFYQSVTFVGVEDGVLPTRDFSDPRLKDLELQVINPAQASNPELGRLLIESTHAVDPRIQQEYLAKASGIILANADYAAKINSIYLLPASMQVGTKFIATRLQQLYPSLVNSPRFLSQAVTLNLSDNKIILLHKPLQR